MSAETKNNSKSTLAIILIAIGGLWLLRQIGLTIGFPQIYFHDFFNPIRNAFHDFWHFVFSWPVLLVVIGVVLLAGKRNTGGLVLIIIGGLFLLPKIFFIPGLTAALIIPIVLIGIGVALIARLI